MIVSVGRCKMWNTHFHLGLQLPPTNLLSFNCSTVKSNEGCAHLSVECSPEKMHPVFDLLCSLDSGPYKECNRSTETGKIN